MVHPPCCITPPVSDRTLIRNASNNRACQPFLVPQCVPLRFDSFRVGRAILLSFVGSGSGGRKSGR